jgi:hypothetical protein
LFVSRALCSLSSARAALQPRRLNLRVQPTTGGLDGAHFALHSFHPARNA